MPLHLVVLFYCDVKGLISRSNKYFEEQKDLVFLISILCEKSEDAPQTKKCLIEYYEWHSVWA